MEAPKIIVAFLAIALICDFVLFDWAFTRSLLQWVRNFIEPGVSID